MGFGSVQPFVPLYAVVLGKGGHIFMNFICIFALWLVSYPLRFDGNSITNLLSEHCDRNYRRFPSCVRRRP
jgi:hypothetical protein